MKSQEIFCSSLRKNDAEIIIRDLKLSFNRIPSQHFFKCHCEKYCSTMKRLNMPGSVINQKLGRLLQDTDIPALLIFLEKNQDVTNINLACNDITDAGFKSLLDHSILYQNIRELNIRNNDITESGVNYMHERGEQLKIRDLRLKGNKLGVEGSKKLALFLLKNTSILCLDAAQVDQTGSSIIYFPMVLSSDQDSHNDTLRVLDISRPLPGCMHYFDSEHFASIIGHMLRKNTCLLELHLQKYGFGCHDVEVMMSNGKYNGTLHVLDLCSNNIGDHGVDYIADWLSKRPALRTLLLSANIITDSGARALSFALPFSKLLFLDISYNRIVDDGILAILNSLKKSPLLRGLKMFGNRMGHPSAKVIKRMLVSGVLTPEGLDVKPYRIDHRWYLARYEGDSWRERYQDIPYTLFTTPPIVVPVKVYSKRTYHKYVYSKTSEIKMLQPSVATASGIIGKHSEDCRCCYCLTCDEFNYDELCRDPNHPYNCECCKCKVDESSSDLSFPTRVESKDEFMKKIAPILRCLSSQTCANIERWVNMNENTLEEDLKAITGQKQDEEEASTAQSKDSCTCSWVPLSISMVLKYLEGVALKDILVNRNDSSDSGVTCKNP